MELISLIPITAGVLFIVFTGYIAIKDTDVSRMKKAWIFPATLSALFLIFSLSAVITEGSLGFWTEHTQDLWGNQIWLDLLFAVGIGWFLIVPQTKAVGMRPLPWLMLVVSTGCIGFLAMVARMLYLREAASK